ncbi:MAG: hypothetical protein ACI8QZ_000947 [Chlamydiales bacterium]|jgi:hypothetical protein
MVIDLLGGLLSALLLIAAAFVTSYRVAWVWIGPSPAILRAASVLLIGTWLATAAFHLLLALGAFACWAALPAALLLAAASCRWIGPHPTGRLLRRDARVLRRITAQSLGRPSVLALLCLAPFVVLRLVRGLVQPTMGWDSLVYHLPRAAMFVQEGAFTFDPAPGSWSFYRNVFAGGEVLWAWAMLPFGNDVLVGCAGAVPWLGVGLATWAFARALRLREPFASLAGALVLFIPTLQLEVPSGYVEPPACMAVMTAMAAAVHGLRRSARRAPGLLLLAAMGAGVAFGVKPPLAIPAVLACVPLVALTWNATRGRRLWSIAIATAVAAILPALPWAIHAWIDTGAPLSPMPLSVFGLTLGKADPHLRFHLSGDISGAYTWAREWRVLREIFPGPMTRVEGLGVLSAIPLALAPIGLWRLARRAPMTGALLLIALLATCAFLYLPGFTRPRLHQSANVSRFLIVPILLAIPISMLGLERLARTQRAYASLLWGCAVFYATSFAPHGAGLLEQRRVGLALALLAAIALSCWVLARLARTRRGPAITATRALLPVLISSALLFALRKDQLEHRFEAARTSFQVHRTPTYWVAGARAVDDPQHARTLAVTAGSSSRAAYWYSYFFMGSELQNHLRYVPVTVDGDIAHFGPESPRTSLADRAAWMRRLRAEGVTHVVSFRPASIELAWMRSAPGRFRPVHASDDWGVFELLPRDN